MDHKDQPVTTVKAKAAPAAEKRPANLAHPSLRVLERPANLTGTNAPGFGSDVVADTLRALEIPYIALNPGASYRGLHDSIVNFLGNETPQMLLCLHEENAVAIAHGYAKVTGKAMAVAGHSNVGLFHGSGAARRRRSSRLRIIRSSSWAAYRVASRAGMYAWHWRKRLTPKSSATSRSAVDSRPIIPCMREPRHRTPWA